MRRKSWSAQFNHLSSVMFNHFNWLSVQSFGLRNLGSRPDRENLGRALGHFIFSLIELKRILFTIFSKALKAPPRNDKFAPYTAKHKKVWFHDSERLSSRKEPQHHMVRMQS